MFSDCVFLAQSDTTAGLLCLDFKRLNTKKGRQSSQKVILTLGSFQKLKELVRIPQKYKKIIRNSPKTTFIYRGKNRLVDHSLGIRVVRDSLHSEFLCFFPYLYSTSANPHKQNFDLEFALKSADVWVIDKRGFTSSKASRIFRVGNDNLRIVR